jgi:oligopeptide/dipeptide ABC transporter ATP-binding protein
LELDAISKDFRVPGHRGVLSAVSSVSFTINEGETLGLVGESGCGKSTTARVIVQAWRPTSGRVLLRGVDLTLLRGSSLRAQRRQIQMVFQDPYSSLDPRWKVRNLVAEPLRVNHVGTRAEREQRVEEVLSLVGLDPGQFADRRPGNLSGGQAQRVGIARALALAPSLVICDEAVSSLDVSIRAQILNLLEELRSQLKLTYLFIAHDLTVVRHVSDRVGVMYLGTLCEYGPSESIYRRPAHPYTASLLAAVADSGVQLDREELGEIASPLDPPSGCRYRTRCPYAQARCAEEAPAVLDLGDGHRVACHFPLAGKSSRE